MDLNQTFSELLIKQTKGDHDDFNLSESAPLFCMPHPKVLKAIQTYKHSPNTPPVEVKIPGWYFQCFPEHAEAKRATVANFHSFLNGNEAQAYFHFDELGAVLLSRTELPSNASGRLVDHTLPPLVSYALSQDLWGAHGKWPRFHARLTQLFSSKALLKSASVGRYVLDPKAREKLEEKGIRGTMVLGNFELNLPWTFPLSALTQLEQLISQEF